MTAVTRGDPGALAPARFALSRSAKRRLFHAFRYGALTLWLLVVAFPIYWMVATSLKPEYEWFTSPPIYFSENWTFENFLAVWTSYTSDLVAQEGEAMQRPWEALGNSLVVAIIATSLSVGFGGILAYGVSRYRILSEFRMFQLLILRMIPPIVVAAPLSLYYATLGLLDTVTGLVIVYFITTLPYAVWMSKSFIDEVPLEIEQAAEVLGASRVRVIWEIVLPLIRSGLIATFLFILILTWSEFLLALILSKADVVTLPMELSKYEGSTEGRVYGRQAALSVGITLPLIIVGLIIRRHLARGFSFGMVRR